MKQLLKDSTMSRETIERLTRRHFFGKSSLGVGTFAMSNLLHGEVGFGSENPSAPGLGGILSATHHAAKAKRVVFYS